MTEGAQERKRKSKSRFSRWLRSFSGILASVATIVAALASVVAAHQTSRVNQLTITVRQQRQQLEAAGAQPAAHSSTTPSGSTGNAVLTGVTYLSALQPTVSDAQVQTGQQAMSARTYPNSIMFGCDGTLINGQPDVAYDVAGHTLFHAAVGIPDDAQDATNVNETVSFANQSGALLIKPVVVSLGKLATVQINISGVTQLEMTCTGTNTQSQQPDDDQELALGNAYVSG
jgi:hypothetical protein